MDTNTRTPPVNGTNGTAPAVCRSRDEFVERWKRHLAGLALFGVASDVKDGVLTRASKVLDIPDEVVKLLGQMWDDLTTKRAAKPAG